MLPGVNLGGNAFIAEGDRSQEQSISHINCAFSTFVTSDDDRNGKTIATPSEKGRLVCLGFLERVIQMSKSRQISMVYGLVGLVGGGRGINKTRRTRFWWEMNAPSRFTYVD